jgi:hypothetical protein
MADPSPWTDTVSVETRLGLGFADEHAGRTQASTGKADSARDRMVIGWVNSF